MATTKQIQILGGLQGNWEQTDTTAPDYIKNKPTSLPAQGGDATTVNGHTVESDVPIDAKFTDTTYEAAGADLGLVKSGGDVTIENGIVTIQDDSHNHTIENVDGLQDALDDKASTAYVDTKVADMVDSAPETLNTLNELAAALGDDPNFATTVATEIGKKVDKVEGKGLSTNDYTNEEKTQVAKIAELENILYEPNAQASTYIICASNSANKEGAIIATSLVGALESLITDSNFKTGSEIVIRKGSYTYDDKPLTVDKSCYIRAEGSSTVIFTQTINLNASVKLDNISAQYININAGNCCVENCSCETIRGYSSNAVIANNVVDNISFDENVVAVMAYRNRKSGNTRLISNYTVINGELTDEFYNINDIELFTDNEISAKFGDIETALTDLHTYAQSLIGGEGA